MSVTKVMKYSRSGRGAGVLVVLLLCVLGASLPQPALAQGDAFLNVVVDDRVVIAPLGSFIGAPANVPSPEIERTANGDLYIKAENLNFYKSTDNGQTWAAQPTNVPGGGTLGNFGITDQDRFYAVTQTNSSNLSVHYSDDYGATWTGQSIDITSLDPPGGTQDYPIAFLVRGPVVELDDGTLQFGVDLRHKDDAFNPWPSATPFGETLIRSTNNGTTWGDPNFLRLPDSYLFETDYAVDPLNPDHIFAATRAQRMLLPGEDDATVRALTGAPAGVPFVYKNGLLMESTDGGRTFDPVVGGLLGYYEHRNSIAWTGNGVVALLSQESNQVNAGTGGVVARLSMDSGQTWFNGGSVGHAEVGDPTVGEFVLHNPDSMGGDFNALGMSSTIEIGFNTFFTAFGGFEGATTGMEHGAILGVRWHLEGDLVLPLGDFNADGSITSADFDIMKANFLSTGNAMNSNGEVTGDGTVDLRDFQLFKKTLFPGPASALSRAVPEPNTVVLIFAAAPALLLLRFRAGYHAPLCFHLPIQFGLPDRIGRTP